MTSMDERRDQREQGLRCHRSGGTLRRFADRNAAGAEGLSCPRRRPYTFPSDVVSTHVVQPPGVAALARWGLLERVTTVRVGCWLGTPVTTRIRSPRKALPTRFSMRNDALQPSTKHST